MTTDAPPETGVRARTRRAILDAAVRVWARDFAAPLGDIADHAGVARSTLHRYYPDRQSLLRHAYDHALAWLESAAQSRAEGAAIDHLERALRGGIAAGDAVIFLFADASRFAGMPGWDDTDPDPDMIRLIETAQREGAIATDLDPTWVLSIFYSVLYTGAETVAGGAMPLHVVSDLAIRTLLRGVGA